MKKLICLIPVMIIILMLSQDVKTYAAAIDNYNVVIIFREGRDYKIAAFDSLTITRQELQGEVYYYEGNFRGYSQSRSSFSSIGDAIAYISNIEYFYAYGSPYSFQSPVIVVKGNVVNNTGLDNDTFFDSIQDYEDYINPPTPTPEPSWYQKMWDDLYEQMGTPEFWFGEWFVNLIDMVFNNDEEPSQGPSRLSNSTHLQQVSPAPTPTPIPYSTITVPRTDIITGETVYETNYYYQVSGTPIVATSPPTNTPSNNNNGGGGGSSQDYNPVDPYSIPQVGWFTAAEIGDTSYDGIDSIYQGFDSIDTVGSQYTDGMSAVEDAMGTVPSDWLLLIGIAAAIPLLAGIISRFLS